jgi:hypothetical protein
MGGAVGIFVMGANTLGFVLAGLFFLRFWRRTHDYLFAAFAVAFFLLALNQALVALSGIPREDQSAIYLLRLAGFSLLIAAIIGKNVRARRR